jgi:hypothetical protein
VIINAFDVPSYDSDVDHYVISTLLDPLNIKMRIETSAYRRSRCTALTGTHRAIVFPRQPPTKSCHTVFPTQTRQPLAFLRLHSSPYDSYPSYSVVTICTTCYNIPKLCILPTECICVFRTVLTINSDCFPKQH